MNDGPKVRLYRIDYQYQGEPNAPVFHKTWDVMSAYDAADALVQATLSLSGRLGVKILAISPAVDA